jgi:hypothetical protein
VARPETQGGGATRPEERDDPEGGLGRSGLCRPIGQLDRSGPRRSGGACWAGAE